MRKKSDVKLGSAEDDGFNSRDCVRGVCSQIKVIHSRLDSLTGVCFQIKVIHSRLDSIIL